MSDQHSNTNSEPSTGLSPAVSQALMLVRNDMIYRSRIAKAMSNADTKDIDAECGYPELVSPEEYKRMFKREGFAKRLVSIYPEECWSDDPKIYETEDDEQVTQFEEEFNELVKTRQIWHYLLRLDILSGIGRYGILLIGIDDGKSLDQPAEGVTDDAMMPESNAKKRNVIYLKPFDETAINISKWNTDDKSPRYGYPEFYEIKVANVSGAQGDVSTTTTMKVHWSRVLHVADDRESSDVYGTPRLEPVYNRAYDVRKIAGGAGEMFWKGGFPGLATEIDPDTEIDTKEAREQIKAYQDGLQRVLGIQGVKVKELSPQVADPSNHLKAMIMLAAMSRGIPYRIFMGTEEAQLAGSQDSNAWSRRLHSRNTKYVAPLIIMPFITRLVQMGVLSAPDKKNGVTAYWPDPDNLTEKDRAEISEKRSKALATYVTSGAESVMPLTEFLSIVLQLPQSEIKQIIKEREKQIKDDEVDEDEVEEDTPEEDDESDDEQ